MLLSLLLSVARVRRRAALCSGVLAWPGLCGPGQGGLAGYPAGGGPAGGVGLQVWAAV